MQKFLYSAATVGSSASRDPNQNYGDVDVIVPQSGMQSTACRVAATRAPWCSRALRTAMAGAGVARTVLLRSDGAQQ